MDIKNSEGYKSLLKSVEHDLKNSGDMHDYRKKMQWVLDRAKHYSEKTGIDASEILDAWEEQRNHWYMNYYQDNNQPKIHADSVRVFDTLDDLRKAIGEKREYRCPMCERVTTDPYNCNIDDSCNWKAYGLLKTLGKGTHVFVKTELTVSEIFTPISWETEQPKEEIT